MKRELYQFYPEVYPFNLWIYVGKDVSGMVECFNNDFSYVDNSKAVTVSVPYGGCKLNPNTGFLIWFINKKIIDFETVCHESSHVSTEAFNFLGEEVKNSEPFSYLICDEGYEKCLCDEGYEKCLCDEGYEKCLCDGREEW